VARCYYCGGETDLHQAGAPTCVNCTNKVAPGTGSIHSRLFQELLEAASEFDSLIAARNRIADNIATELPPEILTAKEKLARAHSRLTDFLDKGIVPEDLK